MTIETPNKLFYETRNLLHKILSTRVIWVIFIDTTFVTEKENITKLHRASWSKEGDHIQTQCCYVYLSSYVDG